MFLVSEVSTDSPELS